MYVNNKSIPEITKAIDVIINTVSIKASPSTRCLHFQSHIVALDLPVLERIVIGPPCTKQEDLMADRAF